MNLFIRAIGKRRQATNFAHQVTDIVISGQAVHTQIERQHKVAKPFIGAGRIVLNEIAGNKHAVCAPIGSSVVLKDFLQRGSGDHTSEFPVNVREQMWVGQVKNPNRTSVNCVGGRLN